MLFSVYHTMPIIHTTWRYNWLTMDKNWQYTSRNYTILQILLNSPWHRSDMSDFITLQLPVFYQVYGAFSCRL